MTKIFDELWYGNIEPCAECKTPTKEMQELEHYIERHKKHLAESMTDSPPRNIMIVECGNAKRFHKSR